MRFLRYLLPLMMVLALTTTPAFAAPRDRDDQSDFDKDLNERDIDALVQYLKSRRIDDYGDKDMNLTVSGDVRSEWRHMIERQDGRNLRGGSAVNRFGVPISRNDFDIEFNLRFDYVLDRSWAVVQVQFDNAAGIEPSDCDCGETFEELVKRHKKATVNYWGEGGSGACDRICLKRAYMGYTIFDTECGRFDVELGRRKLYDVFDSKAQFLSRFDGILLRYMGSWECVADWYFKLAGFLVDEKVNDFSWVTEVGFLNICDLGIDFKYSYIDWVKNGRNRCGTRNPLGLQFRVSQWTGYYHFNPDILMRPAQLYGAFLINTAAKKTILTHHTKANIGWYAGLKIGEVLKEGDWALDIMYQYLEAQAVPDFDVSGLDRGNVLDECFTSATFIPTTVHGENSGYFIFLRRGNANYRGWRIEGLYALTDNLTLNPQIEWDSPANRHIGGQHFFSKYELEVIYAW